MVIARSAAEMPVVTPFSASIDIVKAVWNRDVFSETIIGRRSPFSFSSVNERQISPLPYFAMKLIASGVTFSAAIVRSPSFSLIDLSPHCPDLLLFFLIRLFFQGYRG